MVTSTHKLEIIQNCTLPDTCAGRRRGIAQPDYVADERGRGAVLSMALCVMVLIASEFMPVSLLTPIPSDLRMTEGLAGPAISISGVFAVLTSLVIPGVTARLALVEDIVAAGGEALAVQTDVTNRAEVANLVDTAVEVAQQL